MALSGHGHSIPRTTGGVLMENVGDWLIGGIEVGLVLVLLLLAAYEVQRQINYRRYR